MTARPQPHCSTPTSVLNATVGGLLTALLLGCAPQDTPPAHAPRALVYGSVSSPIHEALRGKIGLSVSDGTQKITDYDLVIVDGDAFTGEQLKAQQPLQDAVRSGKWLLALDAAEDDKKAGLIAFFNGSTPGGSRALLARQTRDAGGHQLNTFIDFARNPGTAEQQAAQIERYLSTAPLELGLGEPALPPQALTINYRVINPATQIAMPDNTNPVFRNTPGQTVTWQADHFITLLMDAGIHPQGDFQHVVVTTAGRANPNQLRFDNHNNVDGDGGQGEIAWLQTLFSTSAAVTSGETPDQTLSLQQTSPTNTNGDTKVTTGLNFSVGVSRAGVGATVGYSYSVTKDLMDWAVKNDTSADHADWAFYSQNPYNGNATDWDDSAWFYYFTGAAPQTPNALSLHDNEYSTAGHWANSAVSSSVVTVSGRDLARYTDVWSVGDRLNTPPNTVYRPFCNGFNECLLSLFITRHDEVKPWSVDIDMSAVIPVQVASLTFNPNPVVAGQVTTATLKLQKVTPIDAYIVIGSDKPGIAPPNDAYTVAAGQDSLTFQINTGPQGCQEQSATLTAWYANPLNSILTIKPPPNCQ